MNWIISAFLLVIPYSYWHGQHLRTTQEFFFQTCGLLLILSALLFTNSKVKTNNVNRCLFAFFMWFVAVYLLNEYMGFSVMMNMFFGLGIYLTVIRTIKKEQIPFIIKTIGFVCSFAIIYLAFQFFGLDLSGRSLFRTPNGIPQCSFFGIENAYGQYLVFSYPLIFSIGFLNNININIREGKLLSLNTLKLYGINFLKILSVVLFFALLAFALVFSKSTAVFLAFLITSLVFLFIRKRILFWVVVIPLLIGSVSYIALYDTPMGMQSSRLDMWGKVIQDAHKRPFGRGLDSFRQDERVGSVRYFKHSWENKTVRAFKNSAEKDRWEIDTNKTPKEFIEKIKQNKNPLDFWDHPHSEYVWLFFETGFPGIIIFGFLIYFIFMRFWYSKQDSITVGLFCSLLAVLITSFFQFPFHLARLAHLIPIILALFMIQTEDSVADTTNIRI